MATISIVPGGLNLQLNPLLHKPGDLMRAVNVDSYLSGSKKKRPGYVEFLSSGTTTAGVAITQLFNFQKDDGTTSFLYAVTGGKVLYYDLNAGSTDWTIAENGTVSSDWVGNAVLENTMIIGDGVTATRHTTNGTAFTDTALAPIAQHFSYHSDQRMYAIGTASTVFRSTPGDATNWNTSGTSSSDSFNVPGPGKLNGLFTANNAVMLNKNSGIQFRWDGFNLYQVPTNQGFTSPMSLGEFEDFRLYLNRNGLYASSGAFPEIISNPIEKQIYNDNGEGINGNLFGTARAVAHRYDYYLSAGTITDDLSNETIGNAVIKYSYKNNEYVNWKLADYPTAYVSYKDTSGNQQLLFGDGMGNTYHLNGIATTDNGQPIEATMMGVLHANTLNEKEWHRVRMQFNPGCQAKLQIAVTNSFGENDKRWVDVGDLSSGAIEYEMPESANKGRFLFYKIYESSRDTRFVWYGGEVDCDIVLRK